MTRRAELSGWGLFPRAVCRVAPATPERLRALLRDRDAPPVIARGAGRAYGDAALLSDGLVCTVPLGGEVRIDPRTGTLRAPAGVSVDAANRAALAAGHFLPVLPGTGAVTLGGAVAADIHGKNHHVDGSIGRHVRSLVVRTGDGRARRTSRTLHAERFLTTIGGMGLTGVIEEVELDLRPVDSAWIEVEERATASLAETIDALLEAEMRSPYAVAWIDALAPDRGFGRGFVSAGRHADRGALPPELRPRPWETPEPEPLPFPPGGDGLLFRGGVRVLNALRHRAARARHGVRIVPWTRYFFPLDRLEGWNRFYGKRGFRQHQCLLPPARAAEGVEGILLALVASGHPPTLAVLKGCGPGGESGMSFPRPGLTLALDLPRRRGLDEALAAVDRIVAEQGGRIYLAKDAGVDPAVFAATTPELPAFRAALARLEPGRRFRSDLALRLGLLPEAGPAERSTGAGAPVRT